MATFNFFSGGNQPRYSPSLIAYLTPPEVGPPDFLKIKMTKKDVQKRLHIEPRSLSF